MRFWSSIAKPPGDEKYRAKNFAYIKANDHKIEEMLTAPQRDKLKDLLGAEINSKIDLPGR